MLVGRSFQHGFCSKASLSYSASLAAFFVAQWQQRAAERELAARVLQNLSIEEQANLETVEEQIAKHAEIIERMAEVDGRYVRPHGMPQSRAEL